MRNERILRRTLLQVKLLNTGLIGGDGGTLDTDTILLDGLSGIDGHLVVGLVTVLETLGRVSPGWFNASSTGAIGSYQVVVLQVNVEVSAPPVSAPATTKLTKHPDAKHNVYTGFRWCRTYGRMSCRGRVSNTDPISQGTPHGVERSPIGGWPVAP